MNYCILHLKKEHTPISLIKLSAHIQREINVPNADPDKERENVHYFTSKNAYEAYKDRINETEQYRTRKIRKDAVKAFDIILTFSHGAITDPNTLKRWMKKNYEFLHKFFNIAPDGKNNIANFSFHNDELTPHIHATIIPIDDKGHLCAKTFINGKYSLSQLQTEYAKAMEEFGLVRGAKYSKAKHKKMQQFYSKINGATDSIPNPKKDESAIAYVKRCKKSMHNYVLNILKEASDKVAKATDLLNKTNSAMHETKTILHRTKKNLQKASVAIKPISKVLKHMRNNEEISDKGQYIHFGLRACKFTMSAAEYNNLASIIDEVLDIGCQYMKENNIESSSSIISKLQKAIRKAFRSINDGKNNYVALEQKFKEIESYYDNLEEHLSEEKENIKDRQELYENDDNSNETNEDNYNKQKIPYSFVDENDHFHTILVYDDEDLEEDEPELSLF